MLTFITISGKFRSSMARVIISPWSLLAFLVIPLLVILLRTLHMPFSVTNLLLANNLLLLLWLIVRLVRLLNRVKLPLRYPADLLPPPTVHDVSLAPGTVRQFLGHAGYRFNSAGTYGEQRDTGYWGTVLIHAGLVLLLGFGSYDNTHLFTGSVLLGVGEPLPLYEKGSYDFWSKGLLTSYSDIALKLQIKERILPSESYPQGATEIVLLDRDGGELQHGVVDPERLMTQGNYNICMTRLVYNAWVVVTSPGNRVVYTDWIKLLPRADVSGSYSHYAEFTDQTGKITGRAWFDQRSDRLRFQADKNSSRIVDVVLGMGTEAQKDAGEYRTALQGIGKWAEYRIIRKRHVPVLVAGGMLALVGLLVRLGFRSRRVWIIESESGCRVRATDGRLLQRLVSGELAG